MEYLVEFITTIPDHAPPAEIEQRQATETTRIAELAAQGHALRVWTPREVSVTALAKHPNDPARSVA